MSFENDLRGGYTVEEISAGVPGLLDGRSRNRNRNRQYKEWRKLKDIKLKAKKNAIRLIAGLSSNEQIQNKIFKNMIRDNLDYMVEEYGRRENLPIEHQKVAQLNNCLEILLKGFFTKICRFVLDEKLVNELARFIESIYANDDLDIVYKRVSKVQEFVHTVVQERSGAGSQLKLPVSHIKNLLSASRLHLNILDFKYKDVNSLSYLIEQSELEAKIEEKSPSPSDLFQGKRYIKKWKVRHMKSLVHLNKWGNRARMQQVINMDKNLPLGEFKELILDIYVNGE